MQAIENMTAPAPKRLFSERSDCHPSVNRISGGSFFDQNGDGVINFVEFCAGLAVLLKGTPMEKYQLCFEIYDVEKTGTINKKEMLQVFKAMNLALDCAADGGSRKSYSEAELQSFVDDVFKKGEEKAANKDEQLSFNEFLRAVKAYPQLVNFK